MLRFSLRWRRSASAGYQSWLPSHNVYTPIYKVDSRKYRHFHVLYLFIPCSSLIFLHPFLAFPFALSFPNGDHSYPHDSRGSTYFNIVLVRSLMCSNGASSCCWDGAWLLAWRFANPLEMITLLTVKAFKFSFSSDFFQI